MRVHSRRSTGACFVCALVAMAATVTTSALGRSNDAALPQFELVAPDGTAGDSFALSAALSGETALIGAPERQVGKNASQGAAYVFTRSDDAWKQQSGDLIAGDGAAGDDFGLAVALSDDTAVVGAPGHRVANNPYQGAAYVFVRTGTAWQAQGSTLAATDGAASDGFGTSVAISGDTLVVGAPSHDVGENHDQGAAYVFVRSGATWTQQGPPLFAPDGKTGEAFGTYVGESADSIIVGAPIHQVGAHEYQGAAYVFVRSGDTWTQEGPDLIAPDGGSFDQLGPCAISGDTVLVGAPFHVVGTHAQQGAAYRFTRGVHAWTFDGPAWVAPNGAAGDLFGSAVALSDSTALVAAPERKSSGASYLGSVYAFAHTGSVWSASPGALAATGGATDEIFGSSVAVSGATALVGAALHEFGTNPRQGAAYVFTLPEACAANDSCDAAARAAGGCSCAAVGRRPNGLPRSVSLPALGAALSLLGRRRAFNRSEVPRADVARSPRALP
jgi:hypothetical protein